MPDIPEELVEIGAAELEPYYGGSVVTRRNAVRRVLAAVWDDLPAAQPTVDRDVLVEPRHGQLAYYEDRVEGGDPYTVVLIWRHRDPNGRGWYNVAGTEYPPNPDYLAGKTLRPLWHMDDLPRLVLTSAEQVRRKVAEEIVADLVEHRYDTAAQRVRARHGLGEFAREAGEHHD